MEPVKEVNTGLGSVEGSNFQALAGSGPFPVRRSDMSWPVIRSLLSLHFNDNIHRWDEIAAAVRQDTVNDSVVKPCLVEAVLDTQQ